MIETWKFSKGILLTALITGLIWSLLLGYAYQQHRSSEILTGVIGGLTIILGMLTAEWLRASREQVELARARLFELTSRLQDFLYNHEDFMQAPFSPEQSRQRENFERIQITLNLLAITTRWPQPNAGEIRDRVLDLFAKIVAMQTDAHENGHFWSLEKRMALLLEFRKIALLVWDRKSEKIDEFKKRSNQYRESPQNAGLPFGWSKRASNT